MKTRVRDPLVRVFHWCTAACFFAKNRSIHDGPVHRWLGPAIAGLVVARTVRGLIGTPYARFAGFIEDLLSGNA